MASSGVIQSGTPNNDIYGARFEFRWEATPSSEPGVTEIYWELWAVGRSSSPTRAYGKCDVLVYAVDGSALVDVSGSSTTVCSYVSGNTASTYTYFTGNGSLAEGSFKIKHATDGSGNLHVYLRSVNIGSTSSGLNSDEYIYLDAGMLYKYVYIHDGTSFVKAIPYIHNGTEWKATEAYVHSGSEWKLCN